MASRPTAQFYFEGSRDFLDRAPRVLLREEGGGRRKGLPTAASKARRTARNTTTGIKGSGKGSTSDRSSTRSGSSVTGGAAMWRPVGRATASSPDVNKAGFKLGDENREAVTPLRPEERGQLTKSVASCNTTLDRIETEIRAFKEDLQVSRAIFLAQMEEARAALALRRQGQARHQH